MSIAKTPSAELAYKGWTQTRTAENLQTIETYQSTEQKLSSMIGAPTGWQIGMSSVLGYGNLDKITMKQEEGPFWHADLQWNRPLSSGITISFDTSSKPTESTLTVSMIEMSLKTLPNYAKIWTYYLAERSDNTSTPTLATLLSSGEEASNTITNNNPKLKWIDDVTQLPENETDEQGNTLTWKILYNPTKQGIDYYMVPTYEITEYAKHGTKEKAAWSMSTRSGKLKFPQNGDYGLEARFPASNDSQGRTGRRWLCLGGDISFDGKYYIAKCTYRWANDPTGWDNDMYQTPSSSEGGYNSSYPIPNIMPQINNGGN